MQKKTKVKVLPRKNSLKYFTQLVYLCQVLPIISWFFALGGALINYAKWKEAKGTWLESHFQWQIKTFWFGIAGMVIGTVLRIILIGKLVLFLNLIFVIYRSLKGLSFLHKEQSIF